MKSNKTIRIFDGATAIVTGGRCQYSWCDQWRPSSLQGYVGPGIWAHYQYSVDGRTYARSRKCSLYHAKHAVVGLSKSLRAEAEQMGVRVSVLCPGVVYTPILEGGGKYGKMLIDIPAERVRQLWEKLKPMPPNIFAKKVLNSVAKNKAIIIVPSWWKLFWWINRLSPSLGIFLAQKRFQKIQKELGIIQKR